MNTVWVSCTPRTMSMWTNNIVREIYSYLGYSVFPHFQMQTRSEAIKLFKEEASIDQNSKNKYVIHSHDFVRTDLPNSKFITNIRNPYEICLSFMRFTKCDLDKAISVAKTHSSLIDHYKATKKKNILIQRYEDLILNQIEAIQKIADFLEIELDLDIQERIIEKYSRVCVQSMIRKSEANLRSKIKRNETIQANEVVIVSKENIRAFDSETGFQSGHISNNDSKSWRSFFSFSEIDKIIDELDDVAIYLGYYSEK